MLDLFLNPGIGIASRLDFCHVSCIDVGMLSVKLCLIGNGVAIEVDVELKQPVGAVLIHDDDLDACASSRDVRPGLLAVLPLEELNHLIFWRFPESDDPEVGVLPFESWLDNACRLYLSD